MVKLSRYEKLQKEYNAKSFQPLLEELTSCDEAVFIEKLDEIQEWDRSRDDLFIWIPVLNRIDGILSDKVKKYGYKTTDVEKTAVKLVLMDVQDEDICMSLMEFTCRLLYNTENRFIYSSLDVMNDLLNCPNFRIKLGAIKVLAIMGERYVISRERIDSSNVLSDQSLKKKALKLALGLPSSTMGNDAEHFSLVDLFFDNKKYPASWSKLKYIYYSSKGSAKEHSTLHMSLKKLTLGPEDLRSHTLQQLLDKGMAILPPENWFDFSIKVSVAKAFSEDSSENNELRMYILRTKFNAIALVNTIFIPPQVSSKLFELDPYAFNSLSDFISFSETKVPKEIRLDCLFALECVSLKHVWCSDIMRNLGGNMAHGSLFQILRYISKTIREGTSEVDEEYNVRFFYLISNLADVKTLHNSLLAAGLIPALIDIVSVKQFKYSRTLASANHLLEMLINDGDSIAEFLNSDGFNVLINSVTNQVTYALEHPESGSPPKYSLVYYSVSFRQLAYIRSLLKLVIKLLKTDSGDRIRNLIDSPILLSLKQILENRPIFGYTLITYTLDVIQKVINSEPTIYSILVEAGLIPYIIDHFHEFVGPYSDLLALLPDIISALCLNNDGLKQVKEKNLIQYLFVAIEKLEYARVLSWKEETTDLGAAIDELVRHNPDLKPLVLKCFCNLVKSLPTHINFQQPYLYEPIDGGTYFYQSKDEAVIEYEDSGTELEFWDTQQSTPIVDCFADLFYGMTLENFVLEKLPEEMPFKDILSIIIMQRPPFDYTTSQTMLNFTDVLQLFDEQHKDYAFPALMENLQGDLSKIRYFLDRQSNDSFILSAVPGQDNTQINHLLEQFSRLAANMYLLTDVYVNVTSLTPIRTLQILKYFEENGFELIRNLMLLFHKCTLEETYLRKQTPDKVITQTMPEPLGNVPPIQVHVEKPSNEEKRDNFTSVKHKNTYQVRFLLNKIQSCTAIFFRCFLRLSHAKNLEIESFSRTSEIQLFDNAIEQVVETLRQIKPCENLYYSLVMLNFNTYIFTFPKTTIADGGVLQTVPTYLFYQHGGFWLYFRMIKSLFEKITSFGDRTIFEDVKFLHGTEEILTLSCLLNLLMFLNKSIQFETMENIRSMEIFYPHIDTDYNMTKALTVSTKILALGMIMDLNNEGLLFNSLSHNVPYAILKQVLLILKHIYSEANESDKKLLELRWELIPPSRKKLDLLRSCGLSETVAKTYLENHFDELPTEEQHDIFTDEEWEKFKERVNSGAITTYHPAYIGPQYEDMLTAEDLHNMRDNFFKKGLAQQIFDVLPYYPKLVNAFAQTLLEMCHGYDDSGSNFAQEVLDRITALPNGDTSALSPLIHLFGIFLNEDAIYEKSDVAIDRYLELLHGILQPEHIDAAWFPKALYVYEIIMAKSEVPIGEPLSSAIPLMYKLPVIHNFYHIPAHIRQRIFDVLVRVSEMNNFFSALAVSRILIFYAKDSQYAKEITRSGILSRLLKAIGLHQKLNQINLLESSFLMLTRRCFETEEIVGELIKWELNKCFTTRAIGDYKEKERELIGLIEEKPYVVMRDPEKFIALLSETARFKDFDVDGVLLTYNMKRYPAEAPESNDVDSKLKEKLRPERSAILHLLLSQLMAASKKDWLSEPKQKEEELGAKDSTKNIDPTRNSVCAYMIFLLKLLVELVSSYKQCKFEFLTFDKRNGYSEFPKTKPTAINFFLYQLLEKPNSTEMDKYQYKRKEVISMLARSVLVGLLSTVQDQNNKKCEPKVFDPDMTFIRKYTIEVVVKTIRYVITSPKGLENNVSKVDSWLKIISSMVFVQAPYLRLLLDSNKIDADQYQICKLMIDMNIPTVISECMATLDLNYPFSKKLFNDSVDPLNAINSVRNSFAEYFKIESNEDEDDVDEESDKEDAQNMFKNSTLGMYDVDDVEEDDDDEESLIGDEEDIAFVDDEENDYEVVFSGEEDNSVITSGLEEDEDSSSENIDYEIEGDGVALHIDSDHSSEYGHSHDYSDTDIESANEDDISSEGSDIEVVNLGEDVYDSDLDIDLTEYEDEESDWESGLSELSSGEDNDQEDIDSDTFDQSGNIRRRWVTADGVDIIEDPEDIDDARGIFQGIEHVLHTESQPLFRVQNGRSHHRHNQRLLQRSYAHSSLSAPSLSLLNIGRHSQGNLMNPLGPSGLQEVENDISEQFLSVGSGARSRSARSSLSRVVFSGDLFDERAPDGIILKPSVSRWKDIFDMFYDNKGYAKNIIPTIISGLYEPSLELHRRLNAEREEKVKEVLSDAEPESVIFADDIDHDEIEDGESSLEQSEVSSDDDEILAHENEDEHEQLEPVYVTIDGEEVNIAGTDIDPEFLNALPEEMRAEVFSQHIRQMRAEARSSDVHSREIDSDFLAAIPGNLRDEILGQESIDTRFSGLIDSLRSIENRSREGENLAGEEQDGNHDDEHEAQRKKSSRIYFPPLLDRTGIAATMRSVFLPQPYIQRERYHELFYRLCSNKQNRNDIVNMLLIILTECTAEEHSLEKVYNLISSRAHGPGKPITVSRQLPAECSPLIVANQVIEILQSLLDADNRLKFFFITEHENLMVNKTPIKGKKDIFNKNVKWPIKYLFSLLDQKLVTDETVLMDLLTKILQVCTKPLATILKTSKENDGQKKKFNLPVFEKFELEKIVSIIGLESCNTKVFQQTLNIISNLSLNEDNVSVFTEKLLFMAVPTIEALVADLCRLAKEGTLTITSGNEINSELLQKFTIPSSEQAKLLKIVTAIDYLYTHKKTDKEDNIEVLMCLYNRMELGKVWSALSQCMCEFEDSTTSSTSVTILLPLIESLMVVCKHCNAIQDGRSATLKFEDFKNLDFAHVPVQNLFFAFTDVHKQLLNQMVRSNPKLMSGPFSLLVKNPRILDFDNKRYYFVAKLRSDSQDHPKLSITVRRDQVFLDSYRALFFKSSEEIKNSKLEITFKGESGVDAGGLTREWYQVLSKQMFNPDYALFLPVESDKTTFRPNRTSGVNPEHISFFKFVGMIIGKSIRDQSHLDCHFSREVYKNILGKPVSLKDMESLDLDYYKSLIWMLENDITDIIEETFSVETDDYGEHKTIDLVENGRNIAVTEENKHEYVKKVVEYKLQISVKEQMDSFLQGFHALIPIELISIFDEQELELLISGLPDIDVDDWRNNSTYVNYTADCKQINYFWRAVKSFNQEERVKLLQFVTGTSKVPLNGFKELAGVNGVSKFSIHKDYGPTTRLPSSHTCFNQLDLPAYDSYETLRGSLLLAINEGYEGFGIA